MTNQVYRDREGCFIGRIVRLNHQVQFQFIASRFKQWRTNQTATMSCHEVDDFWGCVSSGNEKITFILSILIVHDNDDFSAANGIDGLRNGVQLRHQVRR